MTLSELLGPNASAPGIIAGYWISMDQAVDEGWRRAKNHHSKARRSKHQRKLQKWWIKRCLWNLRARAKP